MSVYTVEDRYIFACDLCGSRSTNLLALDLHRKTLSGPEHDPEVEPPEQEAIFDICYWCRHEIRHSPDSSVVTKAGYTNESDEEEEFDPNLLKH